MFGIVGTRTHEAIFLKRPPFRVCKRCIRRNKTCKHKEKFMSYENIPVVIKELSQCRSLVRRWPFGACGAWRRRKSSRGRSTTWWMCWSKSPLTSTCIQTLPTTTKGHAILNLYALEVSKIVVYSFLNFTLNLDYAGHQIPNFNCTTS